MTSSTAPRVSLTVTLGGGGAYALGFNLGIADGLRSAGLDISRVPLMGTSGGSHSAVAIATGMSYDEVAAIWQPYVDECGPIWTKALPLAEQLYADRVLPDGSLVAGVAIRLRWFKRQALWSSEHELAELVAASSSPFPFVRPTRVDGRRYIDGGHRSNTSGDLAPDADVNMILAPFAFKRQGLVGRLAERHLAKEPGKWETRTGGTAVVVRPSDEVVAVRIKSMRDMGDTVLGRQIYDASVGLGADLATTLKRDHPEVTATLAANSD